MGKRVRAGPSDSFGSEVQRQFAGLADQWGLEDPVEDEVVLPTVTYVDGRLTYDWMHDQEDRLLSVAVSLVVAEGKPCRPMSTSSSPEPALARASRCAPVRRPGTPCNSRSSRMWTGWGSCTRC